MKKIILLSLYILVSCSSTKQSVVVERIEILKPEINQNNNSEIGETLIEKEIGYKYDAIIVRNNLKATYYAKQEIHSGDLLINDTQTNKYQLFRKLNENYGIAFSKENNQPVMFVDENGILLFKLNENIDYEKTKVPVTNKEYFKQEFIYNGKIGNAIKFVYREYIDNIARPAYTQDLQYDLNESDVIGFKGLRIKVLNATNTKIEYIVLNNFNKN